MSYRARCTAEVGFDATAGTLDPAYTDSGFTWTAISDDVISYSARRGGPEFGGVVPGLATLVVNNTSGDFDPSNASGAHYPDLISGKPLRVYEQLNLVSWATSHGMKDDLTALGGATLAHSTSLQRSGSASVPCTTITGAAGTVGWRTPGGTNGFVVHPGEPLTAGLWTKRTTGTGRSCTLALRFSDAAGTTISTVTGSPVTSTASYQQVTVVTAAPAGAAFAQVRFEVASAVAGDVHVTDDVHVVPADGHGNLTWYPGGPLLTFRGQIDSWLPVQHHPGMSETTIRATGTLGLVATAQVGDSLWETFVARSRPALWWRLSEGDEAKAAADSSGNNRHGRYVRATSTAPTWGTGLIDQDADGAVIFDAAAYHNVEGPVYSFPAMVTVAFWVQSNYPFGACTFFDSASLKIAMNSSGMVVATYRGLVATGTIDIRDGAKHLVMVVCDQTGTTVSMWVDGEYTSTTGALGAVGTSARLYLGRDQAGTLAQYCSATLDELVIWERDMSDEPLYVLGTAGRGGPKITSPMFPADVAQAVIDLTCSPQPSFASFGIVSGVRRQSPCDAVVMAGALDMLNTASVLGQLIVYEQYAYPATGGPAVAYAAYHLTDPDGWPAIVIGQDTTAGELPYSADPTVDFGESSVINLVAVTRPGQPTLTYRNQTSIDQRGERPISITMWTSEERYARELAGWILNLYASEGRRLTAVTPDCTRVDTAQAMLLVDVNDVITVKDRTVDGRIITSQVRVVGKTVERAVNGRGLGVLRVSLDTSPIRIEPMVLDTGTYGQPGPATLIGKLAP